MLNELSHVEPYYDYCSHCNVLYSRILDRYGIEFVRDHRGIDRAECRSMLYEKGKAPHFDFLTATDGEILEYAGKDAVVIDVRSEDNKYLHRDFHLLGDNAMKYCAEVYGDEALVGFVGSFTKNYYAPRIEKINAEGLAALEKWLVRKYEIEEAGELLHTELSGESLTVTVDKCPAIAFMRTLGKEPSKYYIEQTRTVYRTLAAECGYEFALEYYDENGAARFVFSRG